MCRVHTLGVYPNNWRTSPEGRPHAGMLGEVDRSVDHASRVGGVGLFGQHLPDALSTVLRRADRYRAGTDRALIASAAGADASGILISKFHVIHPNIAASARICAVSIHLRSAAIQRIGVSTTQGRM